MEAEDEEHRGSLAQGDPQKLVMPKAQLLCTLVLSQIQETEFWVKKERIVLLLSQAKGDTEGSCSQIPGEGSEKFYSNCSKRD